MASASFVCLRVTCDDWLKIYFLGLGMQAFSLSSLCDILLCVRVLVWPWVYPLVSGSPLKGSVYAAF